MAGPAGAGRGGAGGAGRWRPIPDHPDLCRRLDGRREEDAAPGHVIGLDAGLRQVEIVALAGPLVVETITMAAERVPEVVARYRLDYHAVLGDGAVDPAAVAPSVSLLSRLQPAGYDDALQEATLPPFSFEYQPLSLAGVFPRKLSGTPAEALGRQATPLSFFGTGRPDIMQTEGGHRVFWNRGQLGTDILVERRELVASPSAQFGDGDVLLRDIDGQGAVDLSTTAYFYRNPAKLGPVSRTAPAWAAAVDFDQIRRHPQLSGAELPRSALRGSRRRRVHRPTHHRRGLLGVDEPRRRWLVGGATG